LFINTNSLNLLLQITKQHLLLFVDEKQNQKVQIFELEILLLPVVKISFEERNTSVELELNIGVIVFEVF